MATIDILIPTYNGAKIIQPTLKSLLSQDFTDFRIIICDDASTDDTLSLVKSLKDKRIHIFAHSQNLGYPGNLERGRGYCRAPILFLMGQDDLLAPHALKTYVNTFKKYPQIGAITRPYYWFAGNRPNLPVRYKHPLDLTKTKIVSITDDQSRVIRVFDTLDQLSGLAYRRRLIDTPFHPDIFPCHIYPFASIFKNHPIAFLKDYTIAVRIDSSQSRHLSSIYHKSPLLSWIQMINAVFSSPKHLTVKKYLIADFIAKNYIGLAQIKNYSTFKNLLREIYYLVRFRPQNLLSFQFWLFSLGAIITPPQLLIPLTDWFKSKIYSRTIPPQISFHA